MKTVEDLMHLMPLEALMEMVQSKLKPPMKASYFRFSRPISVGGSLTRVRCTFDRTLAPVELWDYVGSFDFDYNRIPLTSFGTPPVVQYGQSPFSSSELLRLSLGTYGIPIDRADILDEPVAGYGLQLLRAGPNSYRWIGGLSITTAPYLINIDDEYINTSLSIPYRAGMGSADIDAALVEALVRENRTWITHPIEVQNCSFGVPRLVGPLSTPNNSEIVMSTQGPHYKGEVTLTYSRVSFEESWMTPYVIGSGGTTYTHTAQFAQALSQATGYTITADDILDVPLTEARVNDLILVGFNPDSKGYVGDVMVQYVSV